eukprot:scaffold44489_cov29-Tisochrysis_lutea.AAC.3
MSDSPRYVKRRTSAIPLTQPKEPKRTWADDPQNASTLDTNDFRLPTAIRKHRQRRTSELAPSPKLTRLARKLGIEHIIKHEKIEHTNDQGRPKQGRVKTRRPEPEKLQWGKPRG